MALKDKLMTLEDFKAVRDVDVASNSAQFTEIKADLATLADVTPIPDNSDLNDYVKTGLYSIENGNYTILNHPEENPSNSYLEVTAFTTGFIAQKLTRASVGAVYTRRRYSNGQWNNWIRIAEISSDLATQGKAADSKKVGDELSEIRTDLATLADITPIPDNSDLNNYGETGLYSIEYSTYTILNYPPVAIAASYLEVRRLTTGYVGQKLTIPGNGKVFTRRKFNNGAWNNWIQIADDISTKQVFTDEIKAAILNAFDNVAWVNTSGRQCYNVLYNALNGIEYPTITATLSLGTNKVYSIDSVDTLRTYLTVTYYEDASSAGSVVTSYTISGNLSAGTNKVIVQYAGLSVFVTVPVTDFYNVFRWTAQDNRYSVVNGAVERFDIDSTISKVVVVNQSQTARKALGLSFGTLKLVASGTLSPVNVYPIPIPDTATGVKVTYTTAAGATVKYIFDTITKHTQSDNYYYINGYGLWLSSGETTTLAASGTPNRWGIIVFDGNGANTQNFSNVQIDFLTGE